MSADRTARVNPVQTIVVGNEKGGSGKSTVAMHIAIALLKAGRRIATVDMDARQKTFTAYIRNRQAWASHTGRPLEVPAHYCFEETDSFPSTEDRAAGSKALAELIDMLAAGHDFIVVDTPGHDSHLNRVVHSMADILITPINDSFVDFDVLGVVDRETFAVTGTGHYARMVDEARCQRRLLGSGQIDWIVLRNRLSTLGSRNKRLVGDSLKELARRLEFRCIEGLAERVIFREFFPRGLTAFDELDERTLGTRATMSHMTARMEVENLLIAMELDRSVEGAATGGKTRDAA